MTLDPHMGPRVLPHLRDEHDVCETCGRRRRDVVNGICRACMARAEADDAHDYAREQAEWEDTRP